jgi:peptide/nickel transport system ATP-binding protein
LGIPDVGLGDSYPDPANIPPGCRFHPRCPDAQAACRSTQQAARSVAGRTVECMLAETGADHI